MKPTCATIHTNMKKVVLLAIGLLALAFSFLGSLHEEPAPTTESQLADALTAPETTPTPPVLRDTYPVIKVVDGDTFSVLIDGKSVTLRLIGLDTPETVDPRKPVQCFGKAASDKAKELLAGKTVRLEFDTSQGLPSFAKASEGTVDKYGRTLAYVFLAAPSTPFDKAQDKSLGASGIFFNEYMIAAGYAHEYTYNLPYKYQAGFKEAEKRAREEKRGLWADDTCAGDTKKAAAS